MKILYVLFIIANVTDLITTRVGLSLGLGESNPYMANVITEWHGVIMKIAIPLLLVFIYIQLIKSYDHKYIRIAVATVMILGTVVYFYATIHNLDQIIYTIKN